MAIYTTPIHVRFAPYTHGVPSYLASPLLLQYSSDTSDNYISGIRMYRGLRTFALPDHLFFKSGPSVVGELGYRQKG